MQNAHANRDSIAVCLKVGCAEFCCSSPVEHEGVSLDWLAPGKMHQTALLSVQQRTVLDSTGVCLKVSQLNWADQANGLGCSSPVEPEGTSLDWLA
jgi:hypothetical protein